MVCVGKARTLNRLTIALNDTNSEVGCPLPTQVKARFRAGETENAALAICTKPLARQVLSGCDSFQILSQACEG